MYAFIDYDLLVSRKKVPLPNLEIMKMMTYYQEEENKHCTLIIDLESTDFSIFEKIFLRSTAHTPGAVFKNLPKGFAALPSLEMGGKTFSKTYAPLEPELVEYMRPDPTIYEEWLTNRVINGIMLEREKQSFLNAAYYRVYLGDKRLPPPVMKRKGITYIYDEDFTSHSDWKEAINTFEQKGSKMSFIYPLACKNMSDVIFIKNNKKIKAESRILCDFYVPLKDVPYFLSTYKRVLQDRAKKCPFYFYVGKNYETDYYGRDFFGRNLIYAILFLNQLWSYHIPSGFLVWEGLDPSHANPYDKLYRHFSLWSRRGFERRDRTLDLRPNPVRTNPAVSKEDKADLVSQTKLFSAHFPQYDRLLDSNRALIWGGLQKYEE